MDSAALDFNSAVAFELRIARQAAGHTIEELVQRSQLNRSTMLRYLYNQRMMPLPALYQISMALDLTPAEVLLRAAMRPYAERVEGERLIGER